MSFQLLPNFPQESRQMLPWIMFKECKYRTLLPILRRTMLNLNAAWEEASAEAFCNPVRSLESVKFGRSIATQNCCGDVVS
jgi:hypothetical protein